VAAFRKLLRQLVAVTLTSNFTVTSKTAAPTGLTFWMNANEVWVVDVQMTVQCSGTSGSNVEVQAPSGATIEGWYYSSTSAITTLSYQRLTAINTLTGTATHTVATTPAPDVLRFTITNGSTAGACTIAMASGSSSQTTTAFTGSSLCAQRAA
jgi:hypothetical protein